MSAFLAVLLTCALAPEPGDGWSRPVVAVSFQFNDGPLMKEMLRSVSDADQDEVKREVAAAAAANLDETVGFLRFRPWPPESPNEADAGHDYHLRITLTVVDDPAAPAAEPADTPNAGTADPVLYGENAFRFELLDAAGDPAYPIPGDLAEDEAVVDVPFVNPEALHEAIVRHHQLAGSFVVKLQSHRRELEQKLLARIPVPAGDRVFTSTSAVAAGAEGAPQEFRSVVLLPYDFDHLGALRGTEFTLVLRDPDDGLANWETSFAAPSADLGIFGRKKRQAAAEYFAARGVPTEHPYWDLFENPVLLDVREPVGDEAAAEGAEQLYDLLQRKRLMAAGSGFDGFVRIHGVHVTDYQASDSALERSSPVELLPRNPFDDPEP